MPGHEQDRYQMNNELETTDATTAVINNSMILQEWMDK